MHFLVLGQPCCIDKHNWIDWSLANVYQFDSIDFGDKKNQCIFKKKIYHEPLHRNTKKVDLWISAHILYYRINVQQLFSIELKTMKLALL